MKSIFASIFAVFFMSPFTISGDSMEPLISHNDTVMFESLTYLVEEPQRGDIIVFYGTDDPELIFVKRIVGMPGETVLLREQKVYLVSEDAEEKKLDEPYLYKSSQNHSLRQIDGTTYEVPEGKYFVLGDNRDSSFDSRTWNDPFIPKKNIVGKYYFELY